MTHSSFATTLAGVTVLANDFPTTEYCATGFIGGSPVTIRPNMLVKSPATGIVSFRSCPRTRSPYDTLLPPPVTMPSLTESCFLSTFSVVAARSSRAW